MQEAAVTSLREMRAVHRKIYKTGAWSRKVKVRYIICLDSAKVNIIYSHWDWQKSFLIFANLAHLMNGIVPLWWPCIAFTVGRRALVQFYNVGHLKIFSKLSQMMY